MKQKNPFVSLLISLFIVFILSYTVYTCCAYLLCVNSSATMPENIPQEFLRINIYGSSSMENNNTVSGKFAIIDSKGNEIAEIERSWRGSYLAVEFSQLKINSKFYVFPYRIYGKNRIIEERAERRKGTYLERYYNDYGQCMLLGYDSTFGERRKLYRLAVFALQKYPLINFGLTTNYTVDLSGCKPDKYYSISCKSNGEFVISEL